MAGAGKKTFTAGETLTASDVNTYLMEQSVMVFGGTAARTAAVPTPSEGMFSVTTDNDELDYYNGSAWVPAVPVGAWTSWSPVLGTGWLNGNGVYSDAKYVQIGKLVIARATFTVGSTTTKGSGLTVSLPVAVTGSAHTFMTTNTVNGASGQFLFNSIEGSNGVMYAINSAGTYLTRTGITSTIPAAWVTNDVIRMNFVYEAA